jgi:hypothetical protein
MSSTDPEHPFTVVCVKAIHSADKITEGRAYKVVDSDGTFYRVIANDRNMYWFYKDRFVSAKEVQSERTTAEDSNL